MTEYPKLSYVYEIAGDDINFAKSFMNVFMEEFSWEVGMYLRYIKRKEPRQAAIIVANSKYKLSMLGLNKCYDFAIGYEKNLHNGDLSKNKEFIIILERVNTFLAKLNF